MGICGDNDWTKRKMVKTVLLEDFILYTISFSCFLKSNTWKIVFFIYPSLLNILFIRKMIIILKKFCLMHLISQNEIVN